MERFTQMSLLLDIYGKLLTTRRYDILNLYYNEDYSLGEIGEFLGITKQGVRDAIVKGEELLIYYEKNIGVLNKNLKQDVLVRSLIKKAPDGLVKELEQLIYYEEE